MSQRSIPPTPTVSRVTHVITAINAGGAELALLRLVAATPDDCRHHVIVISGWDPLRARFEAAGATVVTIGLGRRSPNPLKIVQLAREIRRSRPDVVQTWLPAGDLLGGVCTRLATRAPVVWNLRNSELDPERSHRLTRFVTGLNGRLSRVVPSRIVAVGQRAADAHAALGFDRSRAVIIRNGFTIPSLAERDDARQALGLPPDGPIVARLGRYHPDKDHASLIAAWATVTDEFPDARLLLAGADMVADNAELGDLIAHHGVGESVHLLGRLDDPTIVYRASDLTVSNSLAEGFPNVVGEAMAHGVPAVVTDVGDSALLVGTTGRIVPAADPDALAAAIGELLRLDPDAHAELGRSARQRIAQQFSMAAMSEHYLKLWSEVADVRR